MAVLVFESVIVLCDSGFVLGELVTGDIRYFGHNEAFVKDINGGLIGTSELSRDLLVVLGIIHVSGVVDTVRNVYVHVNVRLYD